MGASHSPGKTRKFQSGAYLDSLFRTAVRMDEHLQANICARIKLARTEAGMTLEDMADALGVTQRAYWNYENGRVPFKRLRDIAELTGKTQEWLLRGEAATPPTSDERIAKLEQDIEEALAILRRIDPGGTSARISA